MRNSFAYRFGICMLVLLITTIVSCSSGEPKVIPIDTMKYITWDLIKADDWFGRLALKDSLAAQRKADVKMYEMVFKVHKVSRERYFESYRYYESRPIEFRALLDSVNALSDRYRNQKLNTVNNR